MDSSSKKKKSRLSEEEQLEQAYEKIVPPRKKERRSGWKSLWIILVCCVILGIAGSGLWYYNTYLSDPYICPDVYIAGVNLGGMTRKEARQALADVETAYLQTPFTVQILDNTITLSPADTEIQPKINQMVNAAFRYGKRCSSAQREQDKQLAAQSGCYVDLIPYLGLNLSYIRQEVDKLGQQYNTEFVPSGYTIEGKKPALSAEGLSQPGQTLVLEIGSPQYGLDTEALYTHILDAYNHFTFTITEECKFLEPEKIDLKSIHQAHCSEPVDATMDPDDFTVFQEVYGYGFNLQDAEEKLAKAKYGDQLKIPFFLTSPAITADSLSSVLYRDTLSEVSTQHTDNEDRNTNLKLACQAVNGMILYPGDVFSYNEALGERTSDKGYRPGASYAGGEVVSTIGGGICQVSSSLYYAALLADLEIVERDCHMFPPSYIPFGMDATVNWGTIDFQFRNNTNYPIQIVANVADGCVNVQLIGTDEKSYYVEMEYSVDEVISGETVYKEFPPDNEFGYTDGQILSNSSDGYGVSTYRCKYDKETKELLSKDYETYSRYDEQDKVICKIVSPEEPDATLPTDPHGPVTEATG